MTRHEQADRDLERELAAYVQLLTEEKIRAGMTPEAARRAALVETGGVEQVKERVRDGRPGVLLETVMQDAGYAARALRRNPGFTIAAVLTLAIGIGASTAMFTVVNGVLLRQLDLPDPSRVMAISEVNGDRGLRRPSASGASYVAWRAESKTFETLAAYLPHNVDVTGRGEPEETLATDVSRDFFRLTGARSAIGRLFHPDEFAPAAPGVALLDETYWRASFGSDSTIVGKALLIDGTPRVVIGVVATAWPRGAGVYFPMADTYIRPNNGTQRVLVAGRLAEGVPREAAVSELNTVARRVHAGDPVPTTNWVVDVDSLLDTVVGSVRRALYVLLGAVGFVLLIVCANISSMLFARASARSQEIAIRNALGATRLRIMRQLFVEGLLLTGIGSVLGLGVAAWGVAALRSAGPATVPRLSEIGVDAGVIGFASGLTIIVGALVALAPALRASGWGVHEALKSGGRSATHGRRSRTVLVVGEIAFATILLVGAGLTARSLINEMNIPLGFDKAGVLAIDIDIPRGRYDAPGLTRFVQQVEERLRAIPGVDGVGTARAIPFESFGPVQQFRLEGRPEPDSREAGPGAFYTAASPGYFATMRIPVLHGRGLEPADDRVDAPLVVVVNEAMARRFWGGDEPVGTRLVFDNGAQAEVVGVAADVRQRQLTAEVSPAMWVPWARAPDGSMLIVIRSTGADAAANLPAVQRAIWSVDALLPLEPRTLEGMYDQALAPARFNGWLFSGFALVALVLAAIGVFALVSYSVSLRTREIGLRMALGADTGQVLRMILGDGLRLAIAGLTFGVAGAFVVTRVMASILYQVPTRDVPSLAAAIVLLGGVALLASWLPARRASRVAPTEALRWAG